jgi:hypothetical protein
MKLKNIAYAALVLCALTNAASAETDQDCPGKFRLDSLLIHYQRPAEDGKPLIDSSIKRLFFEATKSFVCQSVVNYYASLNGAPDDVVKSEAVIHDNTNEVTFSNKHHPKLCGSIRFEVPLDIGSYGSKTKFGYWFKQARRRFNDQVPAPLGEQQATEPTDIESKAYRALAKAAFDEFIAALGDVGDGAGNYVSPYLPNGRNLPRPTFENLIAIAGAYQSRIIEGYGKITTQNSWKDGDSQRFLSLIKCSPLLPEASEPGMKLLANYPSAFEDYKRFVHDLDEAMK